MRVLKILLSENLDESIREKLKQMVSGGALRQFMKSKIYKARLKHTPLYNLDSNYFKQKQYSVSLEDGNTINMSEQLFKTRSNFLLSLVFSKMTLYL